MGGALQHKTSAQATIFATDQQPTTTSMLSIFNHPEARQQLQQVHISPPGLLNNYLAI